MTQSVIKFMIIDDEPIAHRIIEEYSSHIPHLELVNHSYNAFEAMQYLASNCVDLMFLDINMPKLTGFDFLKTIENKPDVIVTTAYAEFALQGFELNVTDYLLKPYPLDRFLAAINKVTTAQPRANSHQPSDNSQTMDVQQQTIFIKGDKTHHQIALNDIKYVEACGNYCLVYCEDTRIMTHQKISQLELDLSHAQFMRIHKSFIVAKSKINSINSNQLVIGESVIPIGQTYKKRVADMIK